MRALAPPQGMPYRSRVLPRSTFILTAVGLLLPSCSPSECVVDCDDGETSEQTYLKILDCPEDQVNEGYPTTPSNLAAPRGYCEVSGCSGGYPSVLEPNDTSASAFDLGQLSSATTGDDASTISAAVTDFAVVSDDYLAIQSWLQPGERDWFRVSLADAYEGELSVLASMGPGFELCLFYEPGLAAAGEAVVCETEGSDPCDCGYEVDGLNGCCRVADENYASLQFQLGAAGEDDSGALYLRLTAIEDTCRTYGTGLRVRTLNLN